MTTAFGGAFNELRNALGHLDDAARATSSVSSKGDIFLATLHLKTATAYASFCASRAARQLVADTVEYARLKHYIIDIDAHERKLVVDANYVRLRTELQTLQSKPSLAPDQAATWDHLGLEFTRCQYIYLTIFRDLIVHFGDLAPEFVSSMRRELDLSRAVARRTPLSLKVVGYGLAVVFGPIGALAVAGEMLKITAAYAVLNWLKELIK